MAFTAMGTWAQSALGNLPEVNVNDVEIMSVSEIEFSSRDSIVIDPVTGRADTLIIDEGITSIKPIDEATEQARAPRRSPSTSDKDLYGGLTDAGKQLIGSGAYLYTYKYPSVDADGNKVILSALMGVPRWQANIGFAAPSNVLIACHETITSNWECPTSYNNGDNGGDWKTGVGMMLMYTRYDRTRQPCCLVIMPDYEGYGATKDRAHPYLYQELTARQVADATRYGLALYKANINTGEDFKEFEDGWKTVCVGYSQGGSVALATHRFIEENGLSSELHFAGSVCGDGPYDPLEHLRYYMQDNKETYDGGNKTEHERETVSMPIVMPLILKGMCDRNPFMRQHKVSDYLSEKFLSTGVIGFINAKNKEKSKQYSTDDINKEFKKMRKNGLDYTYTNDQGATQSGSYSSSQMQEMLYKEAGGNVHGRLNQMLTPAAYSYFAQLEQDKEVPASRGVMEDLHRALASNSMVSGWTPTHRIGFYHSSYDTVVPYANLLSFIRHQDGLNYYFHDSSRKRSTAAGVTPSHIVGKGQADIYVMDDDTTNDHVDAGQSFYFWGSPSPDYELMKWVFEGKKQ